MGTRIKLLLTDEELQLPALDELHNKCLEWVEVLRDGRKTRSANRKADQLYDEILAFKLPPIKLIHLSSPPGQQNKSHSVESSSINSDSDSSISRPITRSLRSRQKDSSVPSTPSNQRIRPCLKKLPASGGNVTNSNVLSAAINQQHPSISVTKIRQLLRADSVQKKRDEERERQDRLRSDRKAKEERAEAQKKQLLEERAINAKLKREQRLMHAAELRKARELARVQKNLLEESKKLQQHPNQHVAEPTQSHHEPQQTEKKMPNKKTKVANNIPPEPPVEKVQEKPEKKPAALNETFKKPQEVNNIDISCHDETVDESTNKSTQCAAWSKAPHFRNALIEQFSNIDGLIDRVKKEFGILEFPVPLDKIFGSEKACSSMYRCRTSSAVWTPPNRSKKRTSSMMTPNNDKH